MSVRFERRGDAAVVTLNSPPVNAIGGAIRTGLIEALHWIDAQSSLTRVVLTGAGRAFAAGADAREFDADPVEPHLPDVIARIETCEVPWIAAINGVALGGGLELCLGCRVRIASPGATLGLPEVTLGVVPGAGGTQRLPRLIGLARSYEMISTGKPVGAADALELGLIDAIAEDPVEIAVRMDQATIDLSEPLGKRDRPAPNPAAQDAALAVAERKAAGQIAPKIAIDLVRQAGELPFAEGCRREREAFLSLRQGEQAKALRHIFFAERGAKPPKALRDITPPELTEVAVVGGGTMGAGIAYALLSAGYGVTILEANSEGLSRAEANVGKLFEAGLARGLLDEDTAAARRAALQVSDDYGAAGGANLAIEAAFESMDVKRGVLSQLQDAMAPNAVLATNTSYLDLDVMARGLRDPSRLVGLHFFAPAHIMRLLEIVRGQETSPRALAVGFALAKRLRKVPVLAGVCDGFIGNRILARYREAADTVFMDGSTPWEVDQAMTEFGYAMGPYEAQDLSGLDIAHANRRRQDATRDPDRRYIPLADRMVALGKLGKKTGAGWYRYPGGGGKVEDPIVADLALEESHLEGRTRTDYSADEIRHRLLLAMINEAADILHEGIAASAADIDLVTVFGYGFPRWRGGLMHYADTLGATQVHHGLRVLIEEDPLVWRPSPVVVDCAERGVAFADWRL